MPLRLGRSRRPHLHTQSGQLGFGGVALVLSILEGEGRDSPNQGMGGAHLGWVISEDLSNRILIGARSGEQEPCSCLHCGRHSEVK